jgi:hypothetical protein
VNYTEINKKYKTRHFRKFYIQQIIPVNKNIKTEKNENLCNLLLEKEKKGKNSKNFKKSQ